MVKIYTKTGDKGTTSLYDGQRVPKYNINLDVVGEIDELSSRIGMLCALSRKNKMLPVLRKIQCLLQNFNSYIATEDKKGKKLPDIKDTIIKELEIIIDDLDYKNANLTKFILPGVMQDDAQAQLCRIQTRKVERKLLLLIKEKNDLVPDIIRIYINRLSDFFFVLARWYCASRGIKDEIYTV